MQRDNLNNKGFSLTEIIISMVVVSILILGISGVMADSIKAWHVT
jgi:prepilin-type N-terminal cleavage/methylation domain-containing protein